ncbi:OprD family porin [Pseudomonas cavernae]|uniref:OprD family porin n=1 Tax=Pseudomonas cavernae TaxID=2320867 RepID=A0A385Z544_9PSED|nr:OprD family porin [Pseudomonas cavernae]AYC34266.1 OprD family porin [Pseudomonas cavernae]
MSSASRQLPARACISLACSVSAFAPFSQAAFVDDASARLEARNIYFNRDFREGTGQSRREEWAQGLILDLQSGFTEGSVGVGLDALGQLGLKLDSSPDRTGSGLLPTHDDGRAADEYSKLGLTAKLRLSQSLLRYGTLIPDLPTLQPNDGRILPQTFFGTQLDSAELAGLQFSGGRLNQFTDRDSSNREDIALNNKNGRFASAAAGEHFDFAGGDYQFAEGLTARYHFARLDEVYRQQFLGLLISQPLGPGVFGADLRLSLSDEDGAALGGEVDNRALNGLLSYTLGGHKLSLAAQKMSGDSGFAYVDGSDPYLVNFVQINDFANADERSWQARYDYDFKAVGLPGLTFMSRYVQGDDARISGSSARGGEWERNSEVKYVVQSGPLKNLFVRLRNATFRSDFARDADETRVIVGYSLAL